MLEDSLDAALKVAGENLGKATQAVAILAAVRDMRRLQKRFFSGDFKGEAERRDVISSAKAAERRVDKMLAELDAPAPAQGELKL
jgi:hypothetical protein